MRLRSFKFCSIKVINVSLGGFLGTMDTGVYSMDAFGPSRKATRTCLMSCMAHLLILETTTILYLGTSD